MIRVARIHAFAFITYLLFSQQYYAQSGFTEKLKQLPDISVQEKDSSGSGFKACYILQVTQAIDHRKAQSGKFRQRVFLFHKSEELPVIFVTEGYEANYAERKGFREELSKIYNANLIVVEHRYFGTSLPDSINYAYLNLEQATADYHQIRQQLGTLYKGKWISTGISKGGQTALSYRAFYPTDVDATVAYVAPVNKGLNDPKIAKFLDNDGSPECRKKIQNFQLSMLKQEDTLLSLYKKYAASKNYNFCYDPRQMLEYEILEYPFSFWQWGHGVCDSIPDANAQPEKLLSELLNNVPIRYYTEKGIRSSEAFFYQAYTELGFYEYDPAPFRKYLHQPSYPNSWFAPHGIKLDFNPATMNKVMDFLGSKGNNIIYIYGELDPWSATAFTPNASTNALKVVKPGGSHATRILNLPPEQQEQVYAKLENWTGMKPVNRSIK